MKRLEVLRLDDPELKPMLTNVSTEEARENLRAAVEASDRLRDYIENRESRLFPESEA